MMKTKKIQKIIIMFITICLFYFLGGTPILLHKNNENCKTILYSFNVFKECNGKYVSVSNDDYAIDKQYRLYSNDKHQIGLSEQLKRNYALSGNINNIHYEAPYFYGGNPYRCKNIKEVIYHKENCRRPLSIN